MESIHRGIDYPKISLLLEQKYSEFNHPKFIEPDPLMVVREYKAVQEREFAAFIASQFALGRAVSIAATTSTILTNLCRAAAKKSERPFTLNPKEALLSMHESELAPIFKNFVYRFFNSQDLIGLLLSLRAVYKTYGSLEKLLALSLKKTSRDLVPALSLFVSELELANPLQTKWKPNLVASPAKGSACKRLMLFLRWMVRKDAVDPDGWSILTPAELLAPLDTDRKSVV